MGDSKVLDKSYKDFELISSDYITDCASTGLYFRHKKTGLEVFHLVNDDEENLFSFCFRTPVKHSKGSAHILEHSVLCGSEKYPLKEPFTNLMNQSMNTFLNAMTYPDKTVYPASSIVKEDYFNIMDVYGDAVFFPLLREESFSQEAHRLEKNERGKYGIQGVVYNEMKGSYSNFDSIANDVIVRSLFPDTNYSFDSGGDPVCIPDFTYDEFKAFHKKYYRPSNCLVFLYGNIPTEEQLDFLQEKFLDRLESQFSFQFSNSKNPVISEEIAEMETAPELDEPVHIKAEAPGKKSLGKTITINWRCSPVEDLLSNLECVFLNEILIGHDASPLAKKLTDSGYGDDLAPSCGVITDMRNVVLNYGLNGVKKADEKKIYDLILNELKRVSEEGVNQKDIDATLMAIEFSNREVIRVSGPFSLVYLDRSLSGWNYGSSPSDALRYRETFEIIRKNVTEDKEYIQKLTKKYLIDNKNCSYTVVSPSSKFNKKREKIEKSIIKKLLQKTYEKEISRKLEAMHIYQRHKETEEEASCIPFVEPERLDREIKKLPVEIKEISSREGENLTLIESVQNTNGISYLYAAFPLDGLETEDYPLLNLFSFCLTDVGFGGKNWAECADETAVLTGGISTRFFSTDHPDTKNAEILREQLEKYNIPERDWFFVSCKTISEKLHDALELFSKVFTTVDFSDIKRIRTIFDEYKSGFESSIVPQGNRFMVKRAKRNCSHQSAFNEILTGITQYYTILDIQKMDFVELKERFIKIRDRIFESGCFLFNVADEETMSIFEKEVSGFIHAAKLSRLKEKKSFDEEKFRSLTKLPGEKTYLERKEIFTASTQVGYAACGYPGALQGTKESAAEVILAKYLSGNLLWEKIRTSGGAYGASASTYGFRDGFFCSTYRDPSPEKSIGVFSECFKIASENSFTKKELDRLITGNYGDGKQPRSPIGNGWVSLIRLVSLLSDEDRQIFVEHELDVTVDQIKNAAFRMYENSKKEESVLTAVLADKSFLSEKNTGVIINLPL